MKKFAIILISIFIGMGLMYSIRYIDYNGFKGVAVENKALSENATKLATAAKDEKESNDKKENDFLEEITSLKKEIKEFPDKYKPLYEEIEKLKISLKDKEDDIKHLTKEVEKIKKEKEEISKYYSKEISKLKKDKEDEIKYLKNKHSKALDDKENEIKYLKDKNLKALEEKQANIESLKHELEECLKTNKADIKDLNDEIEKLEKGIKDQFKIDKDSQKMILQKDVIIKTLNKEKLQRKIQKQLVFESAPHKLEYRNLSENDLKKLITKINLSLLELKENQLLEIVVNSNNIVLSGKDVNVNLAIKRMLQISPYLETLTKEQREKIQFKLNKNNDKLIIEVFKLTY